MKLITELNENVEVLVENNDGKKQLYIEGIFAQAEQKNRNGRIYPKAVLGNQVKLFNENFISKNRALGELEHPQSAKINPERASHRIVSLTESGNDYIGKAIILNTPMGSIVKGLIDGGTTIGVSTRGLGTIKESNGINIVQNDFSLKTIDAVTDPSAPDAFVNGIMENVEWVFQDGILVEKQLELIEDEKKIIHNTPSRKLNEQKLKSFTKILSMFKG